MRKLPEDPEKRKKEIARIFCKVILPKKILPRVMKNSGSSTKTEVWHRALESTQEKIEHIINQIPVLNAKTLLLKIPGPEFLEFLLTSEYIYHNALIGEQGTLRYLKRLRESENHTLGRFLNAFDLHEPEDLIPYEGLIRDQFDEQKGEAIVEIMRKSLVEVKEEESWTQS